MRIHLAALMAAAWLAALATPSCVTVDPVDRRIAADIAALDGEFDQYAISDLEALGSRAVPALAEAVQDKQATPSRAFWIIAILKRTGDARAIPALVAVADRFPGVAPTEEVLSDSGRWDYLTLRAREAIALIVDPQNRKRFGPYVQTWPTRNEEARTTQRDYFTNVNAWYAKWRRSYEPPK
jgi:hypothetical protein